MYIGDNDERWGRFAECEIGPSITEGAAKTTTSYSPPAVLLESSTGTVYVVVEEKNNFPSFMYSVWTPVGDGGEKITIGTPNVTIAHAFHIASKSRLAEAIITGIANGVVTGGGCVDLMWQFSDRNSGYSETFATRATPFGEQPGNSTSVQDLSEVEPIEAGVNVNFYAGVCFMWLLIVSLLGVVWSECLSSRTGMDVYDRDELITAVCLSGQTEDGSTPPASTMRMFVHKDDSGAVMLVVDNSGETCGAPECWIPLKQRLRRCRLFQPCVGKDATDTASFAETVATTTPPTVAAAAVASMTENDDGQRAMLGGVRQVRPERMPMESRRNVSEISRSNAAIVSPLSASTASISGVTLPVKPRHIGELTNQQQAMFQRSEGHHPARVASLTVSPMSSSMRSAIGQIWPTYPPCRELGDGSCVFPNATLGVESVRSPAMRFSPSSSSVSSTPVQVSP